MPHISSTKLQKLHSIFLWRRIKWKKHNNRLGVYYTLYRRKIPKSFPFLCGAKNEEIFYGFVSIWSLATWRYFRIFFVRFGKRIIEVEIKLNEYFNGLLNLIFGYLDFLSGYVTFLPTEEYNQHCENSSEIFLIFSFLFRFFLN